MLSITWEGDLTALLERAASDHAKDPGRFPTAGDGLAALWATTAWFGEPGGYAHLVRMARPPFPVLVVAEVAPWPRESFPVVNLVAAVTGWPARSVGDVAANPQVGDRVRMKSRMCDEEWDSLVRGVNAGTVWFHDGRENRELVMSLEGWRAITLRMGVSVLEGER